MTKKATAKRKPKTHFAQVPVEIVKRTIVERQAPQPEPRNVTFEPQSRKTDPYSVRPETLVYRVR